MSRVIAREHRTFPGIAWSESGARTAPPLVVCHGLALDRQGLAKLLEPLARKWRLILWDMPGHGDSGALPAPCTLDAMTDALEAVLDAADVHDPVLLGFSFGGMIAQSLLRRDRHAVRALIAFSCYAPFLVQPPLTLGAVEALLIAPITQRPWPQVRDAFAVACSADSHSQARLVTPIDRLGPTGLAAMTRALFEAFAPDPNFRLTVPALVLRGENDSNGAALEASARALLGAGKRAREVVIPGAGHCAYLDAPDAALAAIAGFLNELDPLDDRSRGQTRSHRRARASRE